MRPASQVAHVLELQAAGLGPSSVARQTGLPRSTIRGWMDGRVPRQSRDQASRTRAQDSLNLPGSYAYLLGLYLGDGCLSEHARGVYKIRVHLDLRYPAIVAECEAALREVMPHNRVNRLNRRSRYTGSSEMTHVEVSCYSKHWPALFPQHGRGKKHERPIVLAPWQEEAVRACPERCLRGLIHSDGCRSINTGTNWRNPRYSFSNRSDDILSIFCWACDLLGLHWTTAPHTIYVSRKADVARMDTFIGPKA